MKRPGPAKVGELASTFYRRVAPGVSEPASAGKPLEAAVYRVKVTHANGPSVGPTISLHYFDGSGFQADAQSAATAIVNFWTAVYPRVVGAQVFTVEPVVDDINPATGSLLASYAVTGGGLSGGQALDPMPAGTCAQIRWETGVISGGKRIRGKTYIPGLTEAENQTGGLVNTTAGSSAVQNAANTLNAVSAPNPLVVWSRKLGTTFPVSQAVYLNRWAQLKTRRY